jgi:hypothetical protein
VALKSAEEIINLLKEDLTSVSFGGHNLQEQDTVHSAASQHES